MRMESEEGVRGVTGVDETRSDIPQFQVAADPSVAPRVHDGTESLTPSGNACRLPPIETTARTTATSPTSSQGTSSSCTPATRIPLMKSYSVPSMFLGNSNLVESPSGTDVEGKLSTSMCNAPRPIMGRRQSRNLLDSPSVFMREHETRFGMDGARFSHGPMHHDMAPRRRPTHTLVERKTWDSNRHLSRISPYKDTRGDWGDSLGYRSVNAYPNFPPGGWDWSSRGKDPAEFRRYFPEYRYSRMPSRQYRSWPDTYSPRRGSLPGDIRDGSGSEDYFYQRYGRMGGHPNIHPASTRYSMTTSSGQPRSQELGMFSPGQNVLVNVGPYDGVRQKDMDGYTGISLSEAMLPRSFKHEDSTSENPPQSLSPIQSHVQEQDKMLVSAKNGTATQSDQPAPKRGGKLPKHITDMLKSWLLDHADHPYPTEEEKRSFCEFTGLDICQISNWFVNARRRILVPAGARAAATTAAAVPPATATD